MSRLADMLQNPGRQTGVRRGLVALDKVAPCLKPGNLVAMAGRPGMGKTGPHHHFRGGLVGSLLTGGVSAVWAIGCLGPGR
jgi:DnaB-like helicase C terminal domain